MLDILAIAVGAAVGANLRYGLTLWAARRWGTTFPYGTMLINILGCLLIGFILVLATGRLSISAGWQRLLVTGLLGGFTTFSTFGYETYALLIGGSWQAALLNIAGSVAGGLIAVFAGAGLARLLV
jgi:fluoride exporter